MVADWDWRFTDSARNDFAALEEPARNRIATKLDGIVDDPWREPTDHLEALQGAAHGKLRIGQFRLGCRPDRDAAILWILRIRRRGADAYRGDD